MDTLTINNLQKLRYRNIDGYEVREVDSPTAAPLDSTYGIHAFNASKSFTSLFITIHRDIHDVNGVKYVPVRLKLVGVMSVEKCYYIPLSDFEDMDGWIRVIHVYMNNGVSWKQPHPSGVRTWVIKD